MFKFFTKDIQIQGQDVNLHHQEILKVFPYGKNVRFRTDGEDILVLCSQLPQTNIRCNMIQIPYYASGKQLKFRIRIVAAKKYKNKKNPVPVMGINELVPWFMEKAEANGFKVIQWKKVIPEGPVPCNHKEKPYVYNSVNFEGTLVVEKEDLFNKAVTYGIGDGKAFGFGVLDVE